MFPIDISLGEKKIAPKKGKDKHYWNTIDRVIVMTGANTFSEVEIQTGVAVGQKRIMEVKRIALSYNTGISATLAPGADTTVFVALSTSQGLAAMPGLQENGNIYYHAATVSAGGDGATAAETTAFMKSENGFPTYVEFDDPVPVADDTLSLYMASAGMVAALTGVIKIWYAISEVSLQEALTILESYR